MTAATDSGCEGESDGRVMLAESGERTAGPTKFGEMLPATAGVVAWLAIVFQEGWTVGFKYSWLLLIALPLAAWTLLMRLRYGPERLSMTIGPWRRGVEPGALRASTGSRPAPGGAWGRSSCATGTEVACRSTWTVHEARGVGDHLLLESAERCGANVDGRSRAILDKSPPG